MTVKVASLASLELVPTLTSCIETTAKREFARSRDEYLSKGEEDGALVERLRILVMFLESADFRKLRSESESHLTEGRTVRFVVCSQGAEIVDPYEESGFLCLKTKSGSRW